MMYGHATHAASFATLMIAICYADNYLVVDKIRLQGHICQPAIFLYQTNNLPEIVFHVKFALKSSIITRLLLPPPYRLQYSYPYS